jgi:hypothetical protein
VRFHHHLEYSSDESEKDDKKEEATLPFTKAL